MPSTYDLLDDLAEADEVEPIDLALARLLVRHDPANARALALGAVLASMVQRAGHSAVALADWGGGCVPGTRIELPDAESWAEALAASPAVSVVAASPPAIRSDGARASAGGAREAGQTLSLWAPPRETGPGAEPDVRAREGEAAVRPLVLDGGRLSLYRLWAAERRVAAALSARLGTVAVDAEALRPTFQALFPDADDRQAVAAVGALRHRLAVVAGGPGTGKTTTVAKLLALLLTADPSLDIALATPTGKASDRLARSVAERVAGLPISQAVQARIPTEAATLHRLLRYSPSRRRFLRGPADPIPADVVVVDETSMADLAMVDALLAALRPDARLVLLGDADQLPSVGAGAVFGDLCAAGERLAVGPDFAALCASLGVGVEQAEPDALADAIVHLTVSHRFAADSGIGALSRALRDGDADGVRAVFEPGASPDVALRDEPLGAAVWAHVEPHARRLCDAETPRRALDAAAAFRVLAPTRGGRGGVRALTAAIERGLAQHGLRPTSWDRWYAGRPILVTTNDYDQGLYNGDVGVVWRQGARAVVLFDTPDGIREVPVGQLPEHETAWAMTVHKAQGSEFDDVLFVLPDAPEADRLTRALAYTAVTRARAQTPGGPPALTILGSVDALAQAAGRAERRTSGLTARLGAEVGGVA